MFSFLYKQMPNRAPFSGLRASALRIAALGAGAAGLVSFALVGVAAWRGAPFAVAHLLYVNPLRYLLLGAGCSVLSCLLWALGAHEAKARKVVAKLVLLTLSLGLSLTVGEVLLRAYVRRLQQPGTLAQLEKLTAGGRRPKVRGTHPLATIIQPADDVRLAYELQPDLNLLFGRKWLRTNRAGMRADKDYSLARKPRSVRIAGIGDSGMFGWDCEQGQDYMSALDRNLQTHSDGTLYEVLNFAVPGFNTDQEVACLRDKGLAYSPDIVVVGWCENDYSLPMFVTQEDHFAPHELRLWSLLFDRHEFWVKIAGVWIANSREGEFDPKKVTHGMMSGTEADGVTRSLSELKSLGQEHGFRILVFGPLGPQIVGICKTLDLPYYNTWERIPENQCQPAWKLHYMHPSPEGHRVLGDRLAAELADRGWLVPRQ